MKYLLFLGIIFVFMGCDDGPNKPLIINQFSPFKKVVDTSFANNQTRITREDYFLLENYQDGSSINKVIDSFIVTHINKDTGLLKYNNYMMYFFKKSENTNLEKIKENPRTIDRYSADHDLVFTYTWEDGRFEGRDKIKNGEIIEPKEKKLNSSIKLSHN